MDGHGIHGQIPQDRMTRFAPSAGYPNRDSRRASWRRSSCGRLRPPVPLSLVLLAGVAACGGGATAPVEPPFPAPPVPPPRPVPCTFANATCAERVEIGDGVYLRVFSTHLLATGDATVSRGLIVVHGNSRNPDTYFDSGVLAVAEGGAAGTIAVVAPYFQTIDDGPAADEAYWSSAGWKRGNLSRPEGPSPRVSSYAALDSIVRLFLHAGRFPAITKIVVTGHSAGGQVLHRYAATSQVQENARAGVSFRYVVANPSTYLYLGPERQAAEGAFAVPGGGCADYNEWHYGLEDRNTYAGALEDDTIRALLSRRDVRILIGDADTLSASLDQSCGANLQGVNRYVRGQTIVRFMEALHPGHNHVEMIVPGVGHSNRSMWSSEVGLQALFGN